MRQNPQPGQLYKHFKGNLYQIITVAEHTETAERMVVYQALYGDFRAYVRPLEMFMSQVDRDKYPEAAQKYRFELLTTMADSQAVQPSPAATELSSAPKQVSQPDIFKAESQTSATPQIDEGILAFLDAHSYEERLRIFTGMQHRLTDDMINVMAVSMDTEVLEGELSERISSLKNYLQMQVKYECNRVY